MQSFLRKALYFIDESDYRNEYFECIIDDYLLCLKSVDTPKDLIHLFLSVEAGNPLLLAALFFTSSKYFLLRNSNSTGSFVSRIHQNIYRKAQMAQNRQMNERAHKESFFAQMFPSEI